MLRRRDGHFGRNEARRQTAHMQAKGTRDTHTACAAQLQWRCASSAAAAASSAAASDAASARAAATTATQATNARDAAAACTASDAAGGAGIAAESKRHATANRCSGGAARGYTRHASSSGSHATAGLSANDARHAGCLVGDIAVDARRGGDLRGLDGCAAGCDAADASRSRAGALRCCDLSAAGRSGLHAGLHARPLDDAWDGSSARLNRLAACGATARASATANARRSSELRAAAAAAWRADAHSALRADGLRAASLCTELAVVRTAWNALGAAACISRAAGAA